ncbi:MAG: sugar transferase [Anaerolineales bacterium]|nr:sugar transferase [Anaerolineales bacterium]
MGRFKSLGRLEELEPILKTERVDEIIITLPWMYQRQITAVVRAGDKLGIRARVVPDLFRLSLSRLDVDDIGGIPLVGIKETSLPGLGRVVKRGLDVLAAGLVLLVVGLPMLIIAALIKLESPGPALFRQTRVGERGQLFTIFKFRSMRAGAEDEQERLRAHNQASGPLFKIKDDPRQTLVGRFLRRTSLDELPQFLNILRGEMSLVGPRPGLPQEVAQYQAWHRQRLDAPQGLTGLWQISGRSDLTFDEMCLLDIYYIENWSLGLDFQIALRTIPHILFGRGAY